MNLDQSYTRRVRITGKPGDVSSHNIRVHDMETGEAIDNAYRAVIVLDAREDLNTVELSYYEMGESDRHVVDDDGEPVKRTVIVHNAEIDVTAFEKGTNNDGR